MLPGHRQYSGKKHKYWTTITSSTGTNADVEIKAGSGAAFDESMVKWGAVTLYMDEDASIVGYLTLLTFRTGDYIWFDGTLMTDQHTDGHENGAELFNSQNAKFYMTNFEGDYNTRLEIIKDIPKGKAIYWFNWFARCGRVSKTSGWLPPATRR